MRILANENFPGDAVRALRVAGHDVTWIREDAPGRSEGEILEQAQREKQILVTFDKDFGEWLSAFVHLLLGASSSLESAFPHQAMLQRKLLLPLPAVKIGKAISLSSKTAEFV